MIEKYISWVIVCFLFFTSLYAREFKTQKLSFQAEVVLDSLKNPWSLVWLPNSKNQTRGIVAERNGALILFDLKFKQKIKLKIPVDVYQSGQGGLLDLALDPDYSRNNWIYLTFSLRKRMKNTTALARFKIIDQRIDIFEKIFEASPSAFGGYHYGSRLVFPESSGGGPESLFMTVGERNLREPAQDIRTHIGKIVRFDYKRNFIPEIFSFGHRNPQGMIWDSLSQKLLINDHGARGGDEINIIERGKNYGWPIISYGRNYDGSKIGVGISKDGMEQPIYYWDPSIAPSGFAVYQGKDFSEWGGNLLVGSLKFGLLVRLELNSSRNKVLHEERMLDNHLGRIRYVGVEKEKVYLLTDSSRGKLYRLSRIYR